MKFSMTENKKKVIVLCSMVVLLVVAGTLNILLCMNLSKDKTPATVGGEVTTFYSELTANREMRKNEQLVLLNAIIDDSNSSEQAKADAEQKIMNICDNLNTEMVIESVIKSQGYDNVAVVIGEDNINIFVNRAELSKQELANIFGVVKDHTDFTLQQTSICPTLVEPIK